MNTLLVYLRAPLTQDDVVRHVRGAMIPSEVHTPFARGPICVDDSGRSRVYVLFSEPGAWPTPLGFSCRLELDYSSTEQVLRLALPLAALAGAYVDNDHGFRGEGAEFGRRVAAGGWDWRRDAFESNPDTDWW